MDPQLLLTPLAASRRLPSGVTPAMLRNVGHNGSPSNGPSIEVAPLVEADQKAAVLRVLDQYAAAYGRLDVEATKAVYPKVNHTALRRAFSQLEAQRVTFQSCGVTILGRDANARCQGEAAYRPRVGPRTLRRAEREWTFDLAKANEVWQIVRATVR